MNNDPMFASIIICTYNRAPLLKRLLFSLSSQTLKLDKYEVIVVDDGSEDNTAEVCKVMMGTMSNLQYLSTEKNFGQPNAQNIGIQAARGEYLLFTDDDCIVSKNWAEILSAALEGEPIVGGAVAATMSNFTKSCHNIAEFHATMPGQKAGRIDFIAGANLAIRRSLLEELGGFRVAIECSWDMDIALRACSKGHPVYFEPRAVVTHDPPRTDITDIFKYAADHAAVTIQLRNEHKDLLNTPFFFRSPAMILVASPIIALKVTAGIYLKNVSLLRYFRTIPVVFALKLAWCWGAARGVRKIRS